MAIDEAVRYYLGDLVGSRCCVGFGEQFFRLQNFHNQFPFQKGIAPEPRQY